MTPVFLLTLIFGPGLVYASWIAKRGPIEHDHTYASDIPEPATFEDCFGGCFDEKYPGDRERNLAGTARAPVGVLGANPGEHPGYLQPMNHDFCASNPHDTGEEQVSILRCLEKFVDRVFHPSESEGQPQGDIERFQESGVFGSGVFGSGVFGAIEDFQTDELGFTEYPDFSDFIYEPVRFPEDDTLDFTRDFAAVHEDMELGALFSDDEYAGDDDTDSTATDEISEEDKVVSYTQRMFFEFLSRANEVGVTNVP